MSDGLMFIFMSPNPCALGGMARLYNGIKAIGGVLNAADNFGKDNYAGAALYILGVLGNVAGIFGACLVAGTPIHTPTGSKAIEDIKEGDYVFARDEFDPTGPVRAKRVLATFVTTSAVC